MRSRQLTTPMLVQAGQATRLHRVPFDEKTYPESWLQELLFKHPALLPVGEIEPIFDGLIPLGREVPTSAGPIDLLYVNGEGFVTLVETKLWRNPQALREVFAQIIDYAKAVARWSCIDLEEATRSCKTPRLLPGQTLIGLIAEEADELDEPVFWDQLQRNLALGRVLLLIVGDGIREGVERMAEFLQQTPQLGFTLGLVEIGLFRTNPDNPEPLVVQPRIVARTREITRAVVEVRVPIKPGDIEVALPPPDEGTSGPTLETFYDRLGKTTGPAIVEFAKWAVTQANERQLEVRCREYLRFWYRDELQDEGFHFGYLRKDGRYELRGLERRCRRLGIPERVAADFMNEVARLIPGSIYQVAPTDRVWMPNGKPPLLSALIPVKEQWFAAIDRTIAAIAGSLSALTRETS